MEWNELYTKENQPGFDQIAEYIGGDGRRLWESLFSYMTEAYGAKPRMSYSGCSGKPGWNVKFQKSGTAFGTLYPEQGAFSVFMVISYKSDAEMELAKMLLSPEMRARYEEAQDYMKMGKWFMFQVKSDEDLQDYKILMSVKMKPKKANVI
mgnify:FL=1